MGGHPCIVCPWHSYSIALDTGEGLYVGIVVDPQTRKASEAVRSKGCKQRVHNVVVEDGEVYVEVDLRGKAWESDAYATMAVANKEAAMTAPVRVPSHSNGPRSGALMGRPSPQLHSSLRSELGSGQVFQSMGRGGVNPLSPSGVRRSLDSPFRSPIGIPSAVSFSAQSSTATAAGSGGASAGAAMGSSSPSLSSSMMGSGGSSGELFVSCVRVRDVCRDVKEFFFTRHAGTITRQPELGEFVELELPLKDSEGHPLHRKWTICDNSGEHNSGALFSVLIKAYPQHPRSGSAWMHSNALHTPLRVCEVGGSFTVADHMARIREVRGNVLWLTAGIGITTALAAANATFNDIFFIQDDSDELHVVHLHVDHTVDSVAKREVFGRLATSFVPSASGRTSYVFRLFLSGEKELPIRVSTDAVTLGRRLRGEDVQQAAHQCFGAQPFLTFICGPPGFVNDCTNALLSAGVPEKDIVCDDTG